MNWDAFFTVWTIFGGMGVVLGCIWGLSYLGALTARRFGEGVAFAVCLAGVGLMLSVGAGLLT